MAASGFAGLGYQVVWTQQASAWLGHETAAVLAIVAAFFGGLALGAFAFGPRIEASRHPVRWYAACEAAVALWGAVLLYAMGPYGAWIVGLIGDRPTPAWQWFVVFVATFVILGPATTAMGATLPAIERATMTSERATRSIAPHYASNTFGAVLGVLCTALWLVPSLGLARTASICVALNVVCAAGALACLPEAAKAVRLQPLPSAPGLLARLSCTGLLGIGYEVIVVRVLGEVTEGTVYTFAMLLAVYLVGSALGAAIHQRWLARVDDRERLADRLVCGLAVACLCGMASLFAAEATAAFVLDLLPRGMASAVAVEAVLAFIAFALPAVAMGALFSHLGARAHVAGVSFGRALAFNTIGAALAPLLFGVVMVPAVGPKSASLLIVAGYLALASRAAWRSPSMWAVVVAVGALAGWAPSLAFVDVPDGGRVISYVDGVMASVSVVEDDRGVARLRIDNRAQEGSSATRLVDGRQALLPLLLHPSPHRALFLGLGTGITASTAAADPGLEVDAVELLPEVIAASRSFVGDTRDGANPRLHPIVADARRFVVATRTRYDVIVADNFHPARSGSGALYTVEHFAAVRDRLAEGGLFCQWLPLHQLDLDTLRSIVRSFLTIYPDAEAILASNSRLTPVVGLIGGRERLRFDRSTARLRLRETAGPRPADFNIEDEFALFGSLVAGPLELAHFAGDAPINSDDRPVVAYLAPRVTYAPDSSPGERLDALLGSLAIRQNEVLAVGSDADFARRLTAYWSARDRFIRAGRSVKPSSDVIEMLAQVREPLLSVLRTSPDFRPAYDPLVRMASALARTDPAASRDLLDELARIRIEAATDIDARAPS